MPREHEAWLSEWVEKQNSMKPNEDPAIETTEMKALPKAAKKPKPTTTTTTEATNG